MANRQSHVIGGKRIGDVDNYLVVERADGTQGGYGVRIRGRDDDNVCILSRSLFREGGAKFAR